MKPTRIITNNREIYEKISLLNFTTEVVLKDTKKFQVEKILNNINRYDKKLEMEMIGNYIILKKTSPAKFNIYLK